MSDWYKDNYFWRKPSPQWEKDNYGQAVDGKGDLLFNTLSRNAELLRKKPSVVVDSILTTEDWASESILEWLKISVGYCADLLKSGRRWPDYMNQDIDAKNWFEWKWSQFLQWLTAKRFIEKQTSEGSKMKLIRINRRTVKYRPQYNMTRDPFYPFYACCILLGRKDWIRDIKPPLHLWKPFLWRERRRLLNDPSPEYVETLRYFMKLAGVLNYEKM